MRPGLGRADRRPPALRPAGKGPALSLRCRFGALPEVKRGSADRKSVILGRTVLVALPPLPFDASSAHQVGADLRSLLVIAVIITAVPLAIGFFKIKVAEVVLLLGLGVVCRPDVLGIVRPDDAIRLFAELGLGFLFFQVGLELDQRVLRRQSGRLAAIGWGASLLAAGVVSGFLQVLGLVHDFLGVAIALTSTALGSLLPFLKESGVLNTRFGQLFLGAGAVGEFGPILAISVLLGAQGRFAAIISLATFSW